MDLPPEYVLHLLPLMAICGLPPSNPNSPSEGERRKERSTSFDALSSVSSAPTLASFPYIEPDLGRALLRIIEQWRTLALWEPFASRDRQVPGVTQEGMFRILPVDRVSDPWVVKLMHRVSDCRRKKHARQEILDQRELKNCILLSHPLHPTLLYIPMALWPLCGLESTETLSPRFLYRFMN